MDEYWNTSPPEWEATDRQRLMARLRRMLYEMRAAGITCPAPLEALVARHLSRDAPDPETPRLR